MMPACPQELITTSPRSPRQKQVACSCWTHTSGRCLPWPHPRDIIERDFGDASELENRKIVRKKVAQFWGFDLD